MEGLNKMVDQNARQRLLDRQNNKNLNEGISSIGSSVKDALIQKDYGPVLELVAKQLTELSTKLTDLQTKSDKQLTGSQFQESQSLLQKINEQMTVLNDIKQEQLSGTIAINNLDELPPIAVSNLSDISFPEKMDVSGQVDVSSLPPVKITNLVEVTSSINQALAALQSTVVSAISASKTVVPKSTTINGEVKISEWSELLDGIEELKKGFNLLIAKENTGFDASTPMKVEIVADLPRLVPQPVTHVSIKAVSTSDGVTEVKLVADPATGHLQVDSTGGGSGGGGTQYTDGATTPTHPVGTIPVFDNGGSIKAVSAANPLPVTASFSPSGTQDVNLTKVGGSAVSLGQQLAAASVPIVLTAAQVTTLTPLSSVTANAGTNLNTSTLALESGGNLSTLAGSVTSSRVATNIISGQSGVTGGSGVVGAATQRVVLATDVALPTGSNVIGHVIADTGSTTAVTGNVTVIQSGTWTVQPGNTPNTTPWLTTNVGKDVFAAPVTFTITLASLASSVAGVGRQSTLVTSNTAQSATIAVKFTTGTSPTANSLIYVYLLRGDTTITDDNAGATDAGITVVNAPLLGTILVSAATSNAAYYGVFDTKFLGSLGPTFGIAIVNSSGATSNGTGGNFTAEYTLIT